MNCSKLKTFAGNGIVPWIYGYIFVQVATEEMVPCLLICIDNLCYLYWQLCNLYWQYGYIFGQVATEEMVPCLLICIDNLCYLYWQFMLCALNIYVICMGNLLFCLNNLCYLHLQLMLFELTI